MPMDRLAIIAGAGQFPFMVARGAKRSGCHVTVIGLRGLADPAIGQYADVLVWAGMARLGRWIRLMLSGGIDRVILAGYVRKSVMYGRFRLLRNLPDLTGLRLWFLTIRDKRNDTILSAVADELAKHGIVMEDCIKYTPEHLAPPGVLTKCRPTSAQQKDIEFGWPIAKELGRLDIGQAIAVKETEIIAVEAIEGTDRMIQRAGSLCKRGGWTLIKVAKPHQDMRFDVPTVGPMTIVNLHRHGAAVLVIEADKTLIIERQRMLAEAQAAGIVILART